MNFVPTEFWNWSREWAEKAYKNESGQISIVNVEWSIIKLKDSIVKHENDSNFQKAFNHYWTNKREKFSKPCNLIQCCVIAAGIARDKKSDLLDIGILN